jgi:D-alanyl-D-alanine carboxypeptidase
MHFRKTLILVVSSVVLAGCSSETDTSETNVNDITEPQPEAPVVSGKPRAAQPSGAEAEERESIAEEEEIARSGVSDVTIINAPKAEDQNPKAPACTQTTGYSSGKATPICVVTIDGKPVEQKTAEVFLKMRADAAKAGVKITVVSGFRTMAEQQYLYNCYQTKKCNNGNLAAKPGYSNHQSGKALDLNTSSAGVYNWLTANGAKYSFERTVPSEKWHWEY